MNSYLLGLFLLLVAYHVECRPKGLALEQGSHRMKVFLEAALLPDNGDRRGSLEPEYREY